MKVSKTFILSLFSCPGHTIDHILYVLNTSVVCTSALYTSHPLIFILGQFKTRLLPVWVGVISNCQPTCTTASWDIDFLCKLCCKIL